MADTGLSEKVINSICSIAREYDIKKIILFGSRARGDYNRASDIDLAVYGENIGRFRLTLEEKVPTLLTFDVVDMMGNPSAQILDTVHKEGRTLYEEV
ncbi:MAG: nucleotidyltransferase domain-containing protein [Lachnospiraceae bacterium]|nr:nucleotidyltransferase domain-containing protein [Lachnospiraceae bacterium]